MVIYQPSEGATKFDASLVGTVDIAKVENKPFIIHNKAGARVACGILKRNADHVHGTYGATISPFEESKVSGHVAIAVVDDRLFLTGDAEGLEKNLGSGTGGCNRPGPVIVAGCTFTQGQAATLRLVKAFIFLNLQLTRGN